MAVIHVYTQGRVSADQQRAAWAGVLRSGDTRREFSGVVEGCGSKGEINQLALAETVEKETTTGNDLVLHTEDWNVIALLDRTGPAHRRLMMRYTTAANRVWRAIAEQQVVISRQSDGAVLAEATALGRLLAKALGDAPPESTREVAKPTFALEE